MKKLLGLMFVGLLSACAVSNHYTRVDRVTLVTRGVSVKGNNVALYLTVANPTSERRHYNLHCCMPLEPNNCMENIPVVVAPRSDKQVTVYALGSVSCELQLSKIAHE